MPALLSAFVHLSRALNNRRQARALAALDDHILMDMGLLRTDLHAAMAQPLHQDPSKWLKAICCHWRVASGDCPASSTETAPC